MKKNLRQMKIRKIIYTLLIILILACIITLLKPKRSLSSSFSINSTGVVTSDMINNKKTEFSFICPTNKFSKMAFLFATYSKNIYNGIVFFKLYDNSTGELLSEKEILSENIKDNQYAIIDFELQKHSKDKFYKIMIETNNITDPITLWANNTDQKDVKTLINGQDAPNLACEMLIENVRYPFTWDIILLIAILVTILGVLPPTNHKIIKSKQN